MNERRLNSLTMPVLGTGHGGMPLAIAILFNLGDTRLSDIVSHLRSADG